MHAHELCGGNYMALKQSRFYWVRINQNITGILPALPHTYTHCLYVCVYVCAYIYTHISYAHVCERYIYLSVHTHILIYHTGTLIQPA